MRRHSNLLRAFPEAAAKASPAASVESYLDLYGLSKRPFDAPDFHAPALDAPGSSSSYVLFGALRPVFERLVHHMINGSGLAVLQGEDGSGKSAMLAAVGQAAADAGLRIIRPRRKPHARINRADLLEAILGRPSDSRADENDVQPLIQALLGPPRAILLLDDAELLAVGCDPILEAMIQQQARGVVIVTAFNPALQAMPGRPNILRLARLQLQMPRLSAAEVREYIERSLWIAGGTTRRLITPDALRMIVAAAKGSPGSVNRLMEATLTAGFARGDVMITGRTVASILGPQTERRRVEPSQSTGLILQVISIALLLIGIAAFLYRGLVVGGDAMSPISSAAQDGHAASKGAGLSLDRPMGADQKIGRAAPASP